MDIYIHNDSLVALPGEQNAAALFEAWTEAHSAGRAAETALEVAPPEAQASLETAMEENLFRAYELERQLRADRTPGVDGAVGKLEIALAYHRREADDDGLPLDPNWLLVVSALASLTASMQ